MSINTDTTTTRPIGRLPLVLAAGACAAMTGAAAAGIAGTVITVQANSALGSGSFDIDVSDLAPGQALDLDFDGDIDFVSWSNSAMTPINITNTSGQVIAQLGSANLILTEDLGGFSSIGGSFSLTASAMDVNVSITPGSVAFNGNPNPGGSATAGLTLTDSAGSPAPGADLTGLQSDGSVYAALFNGSNIFTTLGSDFSVLASDPGGSNAISEDFPGPTGEVPFGATVSDISLDINFALTAGDQASGTFSYGVPAPGSAALILLSGGLLAGRRRR